MSRYHRALTMVIEGQLRMPCKDTGSTATGMQDVKQLAARVPDLHVRQPATHPQKKPPRHTSDKAALRCDEMHNE